MSSFLSRFGSTKTSPSKERRPSSSVTPKSASFIRLPRSSTRNQLSKDASANSAAIVAPSSEPTPLPPLDLPSTALLDEVTHSGHLAVDSQAPSKSNADPTSPTKSNGDASSRVRSSVETSPWVKLDEGGHETASERATLAEISEEKNSETRVLARQNEEQKRLRRAVLGVEDATVLVRECGGVIRERGLTTLGLFRPYRIGESRKKIDALALWFYSYAIDRSSVDQGRSTNDLFGVGSASKLAKLDKFRAELKYANVHDVAGVLKWGLRHLVLSTAFAGTPSPTPLAWYDNFVLAASVAQHPRNSFSTLLLPLLPPSSQALLTATLELMQGVAAFTELNAMSARRLSRQLGIYVLGLAPRGKSWTDWHELYDEWKAAGDALEGCLRAFVRAQEDLPVRLRELVESYPNPAPRVGPSLKRTVIKVEIECKADAWPRVSAPEVNDQKTGLAVLLDEGGRAGGIRRRDPVQILLDAFEASSEIDEDSEVKRVWKVVVEQRKKVNGEVEVLSDETRRVLGLVGLDQLTSAESGASVGGASGDTRPSQTRRRSQSHNMGLSAPNSPLAVPMSAPGTFGSFPNKSATHLIPGGGASRPSTAPDGTRIVTPSWTDFASTGFTDTVPANEFGLVDLTGASEFPMRSKTTGSKFSKAKETRSSAARAAQAARPASVPLAPTTTLMNVAYFDVEDDFADVWLDTLADRGACASWPSLIVAELNTEVVEAIEALDPPPTTRIEHVFVAEKLIEMSFLTRTGSNLSIQGMSRSPSIADSTRSRRWARRASQIFSGSTKSRGQDRHAESVPSSTPTSPSVSPRITRQQHSSTSPAIPERASSEAASIQGITRSISRTLSGARRKSKSSLRSGESMAAAPPLPQDYTLDSLRAASLSQERPMPKSSIEGPAAALVAPAIVEETPVSGKSEIGREEEVEATAEAPAVVVVDETSKADEIEEVKSEESKAEQAKSEETKSEVDQVKSQVVEKPKPEEDVESDALEVPKTEEQDLQLEEQESPIVPRMPALRGISQDIVAAPAPVIQPQLKLEADPVPEVVEPKVHEPAPTIVEELASAPVSAPAPIELEPVKEVMPGPAPVELAPPAIPLPPVPIEEKPLPTEPSPSNTSSEAAPESPALPPKTLAAPEPEATRTRTISQASTISPPSPSGAPSSKRFLGGVSDILRRKSSAEKAQAKLDKEEDKKVQRELLQLKEEEKARNSTQGKETRIPTPVSSVRARVLELEAEAAVAKSPSSPPTSTLSKHMSGIATSPSRKSLSASPPASPASPTARKSGIPLAVGAGAGASVATVASAAAAIARGDATSPRQESEHLAVKAPTTLDQLPSPLPSPTPVNEEDVAPLASDATPDMTMVLDTPPQPDFGQSVDAITAVVTPPTPTKAGDPFVAHETIGTPRAKSPTPDASSLSDFKIEPDSTILHPLASLSSEDAASIELDKTPTIERASLFNKSSDHSLAETANSFRTANSYDTSDA